MTSPTGHPDYQDYVNWRGPVYASGTVNITSIAPVIVEEYVTNFATLLLRASISAGIGYTITLTWFTDATLNVGIVQNYWVLAGQCSMSVMVPCLGNFVRAELATAQAGIQTGEFFLAPMNTPVTAMRYPDSGNFVGAINVNINAGNTLLATLPEVMEGTAHLHISGPPAGTAQIVTVGALGEGNAVVENLYQLATFPAQLDVDLQTINFLTQIAIQNNDAVNHVYTYFLTTLGR